MNLSPRALAVWSAAALVLAALSLGPSFAHVLEAPPRLTAWSPELWREATVFNGQFRMFGILGGPLDGGAILALGVLAYLLRGERGRFRSALAATICYALSLIVWLSWVAPANAVLATWTPGPIPAEFDAIRIRWESGHMAVAALKFAGFVVLAWTVATGPGRAYR